MSSHPVEDLGDRVVIRGLELFSGYDRTIDKDDQEIEKFDRVKVAKIVTRTNQFISRKQHPRIVILHSQEDHSEPKEAVGAVLDVQMEERNGVPFIIGDIEMSKADFTKYIASNRFPRRSAEIWSDDHMSEVALLGRDTPRRPLPDTRFSKHGTKIVFAMDSSTRFEAAPGVENVFVPGAANTKKKEFPMADDADKDDMEKGEDDLKKLVASMQEDIKKLKDENRKSYNACNDAAKTEAQKGDEDEDEDDDDDENDDNEDDKHPSALVKTKASRINAKSTFAAAKLRFERRITALETDLAKERFSRELDTMEYEGFSVSCCRDEMLNELVISKDPARKLSFWRENFRRDPVGIRVPQGRSGTRNDAPASSSIDRETVAKLVAQADGDAEKFKTLMAKAKAG